MQKYIHEYLLEIGCVPDCRVIHLDKELDAEVYRNIVTALLLLDGKQTNITLIINSPGGEDELCYSIYDAIKACKSHVTGVVLGKGYSSSSIILQACDLRVMSRNSMLLIHDGDVQIERSTRHQFQSDTKFWEILFEKMYTIYAERSNLSKNKLKTLCAKDTYLTPEEALKYQLIDKIMNKWSDVL